MRYYVTVAGETREVELSGDGVRLDGREVEVDLRPVPGTDLWHLILDGGSWTFVARRGEAGWELHVAGTRHEVDVVDERTRAIRTLTGRTAAARGPAPVRAPMPGLVTRVEVEVGQTVAAGQGVAIIEAMKMENELKADAAGVVAKILVEAGQAVEKGAVLIQLEAPEPA